MKTVYKILPVSIFNIPGLEQWLEDQANQGLSPVHLGSYASFTKDGVPGTRYRLEPWGKMGTEPTPEQLELYHAAGWEYAFPIARAYFLFYTTDPDAPELYSDPATRGQSLDRLARQVKRAMVIRLVFPAVFLAALLVPLFWTVSRFDVQPDPWVRLPLLLLYLTNPMGLLFLIIICFQIPHEMQDYRTLLNTYQALKNGVSPQPSPHPRKKIVPWNLAQILLTPVLILCILLNYTTASSKPVSEFDQPYVALSEMEQEPLATYEGLFGYDSRISADENQARRQFSLLVPVWYEVSQSGYSLQTGVQPNVSSPDPDGGRCRYSPDLDMAYFSLVFPGMSRPVAKAQLDTYRLINLHWTYEDVDYSGADFVILARESRGIWQMAALGSGRHVAVFRYAGQEKLADHLDLLSGMIHP